MRWHPELPPSHHCWQKLFLRRCTCVNPGCAHLVWVSFDLWGVASAADLQGGYNVLGFPLHQVQGGEECCCANGRHYCLVNANLGEDSRWPASKQRMSPAAWTRQLHSSMFSSATSQKQQFFGHSLCWRHRHDGLHPIQHIRLAGCCWQVLPKTQPSLGKVPHLVQPLVPEVTLQGARESNAKSCHSCSPGVVITLAWVPGAELGDHITNSKPRCCCQRPVPQAKGLVEIDYIDNTR